MGKLVSIFSVVALMYMLVKVIPAFVPIYRPIITYFRMGRQFVSGKL